MQKNGNGRDLEIEIRANAGMWDNREWSRWEMQMWASSIRAHILHWWNYPMLRIRVWTQR